MDRGDYITNVITNNQGLFFCDDTLRSSKRYFILEMYFNMYLCELLNGYQDDLVVAIYILF